MSYHRSVVTRRHVRRGRNPQTGTSMSLNGWYDDLSSSIMAGLGPIITPSQYTSAALQQKAAQVDAQFSDLSATWPGSPVSVTTDSVYEIASRISKDVVQPIHQLLTKMLKDKSNILVWDEIANTGGPMDRNWQDFVAIAFGLADPAQAKGQKSVVVGAQFRQYLLGTVGGASAALHKLAYLEGIKPWMVQLGTVFNGVLDALVWLGKVAHALYDAVHAVVSTVVDVLKVVPRLVHNIVHYGFIGALLLGGGYVYYRYRKGRR